MFKDENRHYSLRKLSVGLASVLIGISFASSMNGNSVKADTVQSSRNGVQAVVKNSDTAIKIDAKDDANLAESNTESALKASKKDPNIIAQDIKQKAMKAAENVTKMQGTAEKTTKGNAPEIAVKNNTLRGTNLITKQQNTAVKDNVNADKDDSSKVAEKDSLAGKNNDLKAKAKATKKAVAAAFRADSSETTLNLKSAKFIDPETLKENKTETVVKVDPARGIDPVKFASNGGFDPKIWGTMDTSKWQLDNNGNIIDYTGDMSHIIIPNASDFAKVGKSYQQIGISSDEMKELGSENNSIANTLAISLTDNRKLKASDTNWYATFRNTLLKQANLEGLDTSNVTDMSNMFSGASSLTSLDVSNWDTGKVTNMSWMFNNASSLTNLGVSNWDTGKVTNMSWMFNNASSLTNLGVSNWDTSKVTDMSYMFEGASSLTNLDVSKWNTGNVTNMFYMFNNARSLTSLDVSNWDTGNVINMSGMFNGASGLTDLDVSNWDTGKVIYMSDMFYNASSLTSLDVSNWDTGKVTNMYAMFNNARSLTTLGVSNWDTSKVTNMSWMFNNASSLTNLGVSNWDTSKVTNMSWMFNNARSLTSLDVSNWDTSKVTNMSLMFNGASGLTDLDVSKWDTGNVIYMNWMFNNASKLTSLDVSNWDTSKVTNMSWMFNNARSLTSLDVSNWDTSKVTNMSLMFNGANTLALIVNGDKFADYLVKNNFAKSSINSSVKSVTTDNAKLLQLLTSDVQHNSATRTIVFTFPANYSPDLAKYHLTKNGNTYQIKQSADYDTSYAQGTVFINATDNIAKHHIDTTEQYKLSDTWQPNYDKLVLAHKNSDGSVSFDAIQLPKIPGYKAVVKTVANPVNPASALFAVSFMALPKPVPPVQNDAKPAETGSPATPVAIEIAKPIKTDPKVTISATPKAIDLSNDVVATTPDVSTWQVANEPEQDTYRVSNGKYTVELPHISNAQLHVIANDSTKDSILFGYKGQNSKYVFKIKFVNGHYLLTTYKIKSGKLVKLIDYNFIKSSKMIDVIVDWIKLK